MLIYYFVCYSKSEVEMHSKTFNINPKANLKKHRNIIDNVSELWHTHLDCFLFVVYINLIWYIAARLWTDYSYSHTFCFNRKGGEKCAYNSDRNLNCCLAHCIMMTIVYNDGIMMTIGKTSTTTRHGMLDYVLESDLLFYNYLFRSSKTNPLSLVLASYFCCCTPKTALWVACQNLLKRK